MNNTQTQTHLPTLLFSTNS